METTANNAMRTLKVKSVVTRRGFFVFTNCWHSRRGSRETEGESIGGQHFTQREREREREKEKERKRERERKRSRRIDAQRRESTKSTSPRPFEMVPSRKNEKTARSSRPSLWGNRISQIEREREPAECPTATAYLDRPVREQVILQILQNVTQTHAIATSKTPSLRSPSARVKLVPVQRRALERKGTRGNTF